MKTDYIPPARITKTNQAVIFLAGPIRGAENWQKEATAIIQKHSSDVLIANPRRPVNNDEEFTEKMYLEQVEWETEHLLLAAKTGCILF